MSTIFLDTEFLIIPKWKNPLISAYLLQCRTRTIRIRHIIPYYSKMEKTEGVRAYP
jgi:hypothetical protein